MRDHLWLPEFSSRLVEIVGQEWPIVLVEKWEHNAIGERRFVASATYSKPAEPAGVWTTDGDVPPHEEDLARPHLLAAMDAGHRRVSVFGRDWYWRSTSDREDDGA